MLRDRLPTVAPRNDVAFSFTDPLSQLLMRQSLSMAFFTYIRSEPIAGYSGPESKTSRLPKPDEAASLMIHGHKRFRGFTRPMTKISDATHTAGCSSSYCW
ncbi:hypothetical protein B0H67DRAFT_673357 [Lasiosphaeris hirsuta]|uniref:Uncharacterized protein n=1 Tax=Lasiosphaeris hirsuta TaxID=260670 RepID=A0AA39ZVB4_9PEZI|nr:hypothetical protein B0H67DRAFT_673357 [Lasiosphaeris hirsuta]